MIILNDYKVVIKSTALQKMLSSEYILIYVLLMKVVMVAELLITYGPHSAGSSVVIQTTFDLFYLWFLQTEIFASIFNKDCVLLAHILPFLLSLFTNICHGMSSPLQCKYF